MSTIVSAAFGVEFTDRLHSFIKQIQKDNSRSARRDVAHDVRFAAVEADVGFLAMMLVALLKLLSDKGAVKDGELIDRLLIADRMDGVEDGKLDVSSLRQAIGLQRGQSAKALAKKAGAAKQDGTKRTRKTAPKAAPRAAPAKPAPKKAARGGKRAK